MVDETIERIINIIKLIGKYCYDKFKAINKNLKKYDFFFINKFINEKDKYNILMNLYKLFNYLKKRNTSLFDCLSDNFIFLGETISLFLNVYYNKIENYNPNKRIKNEIVFLLKEIKEFIISFYLFYKDKEIIKKIKIYNGFSYFFNLLEENFYNQIKLLNDKNIICQEFNLFNEVPNFCKKKTINIILIIMKIMKKMKNMMILLC